MSLTRIDVQFQVSYNYPVLFSSGLFEGSQNLRVVADESIHGRNSQTNSNHQSLAYLNKLRPQIADLIIDQGVVAGRDDRFRAMSQFFGIDDALVITGGEAIKEQEGLISSLHERWVEKHLDRHKQVVIVGGGAVLDAVGLAASLFHRGIGHVRFPTTVLAQNDAGVGVKNGMNQFGQKNLVGTFQPPSAVINEFEFLSTLEEDNFFSGYAEAIKVALIRDGDFFHWLDVNTEALASKDSAAVSHLIARCAQLHLQQIAKGGDPFEDGSARPLDFGHWLAHRLEILTQHQLTHGQAVAIGIAVDTALSVELGLLDEAKLVQVLNMLKALKLPIYHDLLTAACESTDCEAFQLLYQGLEDFRQHLGGALSVELLADIGQGQPVSSLQAVEVLLAFRRLARLL
jgi:3-dehydroquinate synthase